MKYVMVLFSLLAALLLLPLAHSSVFPASGNFSPTGPPSGVTSSQADGILIIHETFGLLFTGGFSGTTVGTVTIIMNLATNTGTFSGQNTFTGTVTTAKGLFSGTIQAPFQATFAGTSFQGQYTLFGGTGGLANVEGQGTIRGNLATFIGTYAGFFTSS